METALPLAVCLLSPRGPDRAASGRHAQRPAPLADAVPGGQGLRIQSQPYDHPPGMAQNPFGHLHQAPANRRDRLRRPCSGTGQAFEANEEVARQHADPEEDGIGSGISTRQLLQPQPMLQFLVEVLGLAALVVPDEVLVCRLLLHRPVARHDVIRIRCRGFLTQSVLSPLLPLDEQAKRGRRLVHGVHRFRHLIATTRRRFLPGVWQEAGDHRFDRDILIRGDGPRI